MLVNDKFRELKEFDMADTVMLASGVPRNFFGGGSTNSVEDRGQRERGSGDIAP